MDGTAACGCADLRQHFQISKQTCKLNLCNAPRNYVFANKIRHLTMAIRELKFSPCFQWFLVSLARS